MQKQKIKFRIFFFQAILLLSSFGFLRGSENHQHYVVDVIGPSMALNCSKSFSIAGYYSTEENEMITIPVSGGDLIFFPFIGDENLCYRYDPSDGSNLSLRFDSVYHRFFLNGELISVSLSKGSRAWEWLAQLDEGALGSIRSLYITLPLADEEINSLKRISGFLDNPGFYFEGESQLEEVLSVVNPGWLIAENLNHNNLSDVAKANLVNLELLWYSGTDSMDPAFLYDLPELRSLIIEYWNSTIIKNLQFDRLKNLESLSIIESDLHDLSSFTGLSGIWNLNLIYCEKLNEIGSAAKMTGLSSFGLAGCQHISDARMISQMPSLKRLSLPGNTTQEEFTDIIQRHDELQVLELIECDTIEDLSPLRECSGLRALTLDFDLPDLKPVLQLTGLELLVLAEETFEDSLAIAEIKQSLPRTKVVAGGGFCLGSGWIILILPMMIMLLIIKTGRPKNRLDRTEQ
jgi:hypothetical protein